MNDLPTIAAQPLRLPDLSPQSLQAFVTCAELRSCAAAGRHLFRSASTVSRQVQQLEQALRVRVFHRDADGLQLTADGAALLPRASAALHALAALADVAAPRVPRQP